MDTKRKKNRYKRKKTDGTFDFMKEEDKTRCVSLGMADWAIEQLDKIILKRKKEGVK